MDAEWPAVPSLTTSFSHLSERGLAQHGGRKLSLNRRHAVGFSGNDLWVMEIQDEGEPVHVSHPPPSATGFERKTIPAILSCLLVRSIRH